MIWYKKRTIFGNTYCLKKLSTFRNDLITYFNNIEYHGFGSEITENDDSRKMRVNLNRNINEIDEIINTSGISPYVTYTPPPMIGGYIQDINLVTNIFNIHRFEIEPSNLLDFIDRSIGRYEHDKISSILRTINPFFWFGRLLDFIVSLPFRFFQKAGINTKSFEESVLGRLAKLVLYLATLIASLLTILQILDLLDLVNEFINSIFSK